VTTLLVTPPKLADTLILLPVVALAEIVPAPLPLVRVKLVVSELFQVTEVVMSWGVLLLGNRAFAVNVRDELAGGVVVEAVNVMDVGLPCDTVMVVVAGLTVPKLALICVVHTPLTVLAGVTSPDLLMVAQVGVAEFHKTWPVRSFVVPSLKVPVADICTVWTGLAVMVIV
jgi:hypothetical protein